jgi:hypothetical protein
MNDVVASLWNEGEEDETAEGLSGASLIGCGSLIGEGGFVPPFLLHGRLMIAGASEHRGATSPSR